MVWANKFLGEPPPADTNKVCKYSVKKVHIVIVRCSSRYHIIIMKKNHTIDINEQEQGSFVTN